MTPIYYPKGRYVAAAETAAVLCRLHLSNTGLCQVSGLGTTEHGQTTPTAVKNRKKSTVPGTTQTIYHVCANPTAVVILSPPSSIPTPASSSRRREIPPSSTSTPYTAPSDLGRLVSGTYNPAFPTGVTSPTNNDVSLESRCSLLLLKSTRGDPGSASPADVASVWTRADSHPQRADAMNALRKLSGRGLRRAGDAGTDSPIDRQCIGPLQDGDATPKARWLYQNKVVRVHGFADTKQVLATLPSRPSILYLPLTQVYPVPALSPPRKMFGLRATPIVAVACRNVAEYRILRVTLCSGSHLDIMAFLERRFVGEFRSETGDLVRVCCVWAAQ